MSKNLPKVVIFQEDEKALNYRYKLPFILNSDISVKSIEYDLEDFKNNGFKLVGPGPMEGAVYYLHPYKNNEYVHESKGEMYFLEEKLNLYVKIGYLLGAKSITTKVDLTESETLEIDANGKLKVKLVELETGVKNSTEAKYRQTLEISDNYEKQDNFDLYKNIDQLRKFIDEFNLHHELSITSLIDARDSRESGTILVDRSVKSEMSSEYKTLLEVSAQLSSPIFSVGANFKRSLETVNRLNIDIKFDF